MAAQTPPLTQAQDAELVKATLRGDRAAFNTLILRHQAGVVNVVYRLCGDPALAEDMAQDTFLRAWQKLEMYNPTYPLRSWLYRIAVNLALDALRRTRPMDDIDTDAIAERLPAPGVSPEEAVSQRERARQVQQAVLALPTAARAVIVLREYEGMTYREIANALDIPTGTVMSRLNYGRKLLSAALADELRKETTLEPFAIAFA